MCLLAGDSSESSSVWIGSHLTDISDLYNFTKCNNLRSIKHLFITFSSFNLWIFFQSILSLSLPLSCHICSFPRPRSLSPLHVAWYFHLSQAPNNLSQHAVLQPFIFSDSFPFRHSIYILNIHRGWMDGRRGRKYDKQMDRRQIEIGLRKVGDQIRNI